MIAALAVQAVVLLIAWAGLYFAGIEVLWGIHRVPVSGALGLVGALLSYWIGRAITCSHSVAGVTLRGHCEKLHRVFRHLTWWQIGALALAAGICEELLFRGFLQPWVTSVSTPILGLLVASVVFGLLHYASFIYFAITAVMGVILGAVYWWSESLIAVVVWHGVYDFMALAVLAKYPHLLGLQREVPV
ncbi:CPBP family intramembrane glutamic endopeptidase [Microbulbifer pacificus]|uniref:CPBP family intramembrane glutamic endopeptidase n=1 Tax=Microbulbifer pacificus TaxID=407164 RepID=UPI00131A2D76|nr:CPBP family intramembrane glutamic endopeptidase [Microbulbifer pacificus]